MIRIIGAVLAFISGYGLYKILSLAFLLGIFSVSNGILTVILFIVFILSVIGALIG